MTTILMTTTGRSDGSTGKMTAAVINPQPIQSAPRNGEPIWLMWFGGLMAIGQWWPTNDHGGGYWHAPVLPMVMGPPVAWMPISEAAHG